MSEVPQPDQDPIAVSGSGRSNEEMVALLDSMTGSGRLNTILDNPEEVGLRTITLEPGVPYTVSDRPEDFPPAKDRVTRPVVGANKPGEAGYVTQELVTVVRAGGENFAIVKMFKSPSSKALSTVVTRVGASASDGGANVVGVVDPGAPFVVGRTMDPDFSVNLSREHFSVALREDGKVEITDLNSTNGTQIVKAREEKVYIAKSEERERIVKNAFHKNRLRRAIGSKDLLALDVMTEEEFNKATATNGLKRLIGRKQSPDIFQAVNSAPQNSPFDSGHVYAAWHAKGSEVESILRRNQ